MRPEIGTCPTGPAWADKPDAVGAAHQLVECSAAGTCNRDTGLCDCYTGFSGDACQRGIRGQTFS